jgi:hypothetical protein
VEFYSLAKLVQNDLNKAEPMFMSGIFLNRE